ncbi:MAG: hypothetical protein EOO03_17885, partial [Chitinophagaceae bacterium]
MKSFLPLAALLLAITSATAQSDHPKAFVGVGGGISIPQGDFAGTHHTKFGQGFAKNGSHVDISVGYRFANHFGGMLLLRGQNNVVDIEQMAKSAIPTSPGTIITVESENWRQTSIMAGIFGILPIGVEKKFALEARGMTGYAKAVLPERTTTVTRPADAYWIKNKESESLAFSYLAGLSFRYNLSPRFALSLSGDYMASQHTFKDVTYVNTYGETI